LQNIRNEFFKILLYDLKNTYNELNKVTEEINKISTNFSNRYYADNNENINEEFNKLKANIEKIKQYNYQVTEEINKWYRFTNNSREIVKFTFPVKFYWKRCKLKKNIAAINKHIYRISVENRLIKEGLKKIERAIESNTLLQIKNSGIYKDYEELLRKKETRLADIAYLLPTIPSLPRKIDLNNINIEVDS